MSKLILVLDEATGSYVASIIGGNQAFHNFALGTDAKKVDAFIRAYASNQFQPVEDPTNPGVTKVLDYEHERRPRKSYQYEIIG